MMKPFAPCVLLAIAVLAATPLPADDVSDAQRMICAPTVVHECRTDGDCVGAPPWEHDIGPFVEVDLKRKVIASTARDRSTTIRHIERDGELIVVQAYEQGRAFSMVISGPSGFFSASITLDDGGMTIFGACKPHEADK